MGAGWSGVGRWGGSNITICSLEEVGVGPGGGGWVRVGVGEGWLATE